MSEIVILENKFVTLKFHEEAKIVHHECHQSIIGEHFRECLTAGAEFMKLHHGRKWLSDDRKLSSISPEDIHWAKTIWAPETIKNGWRYWAIVLPQIALGTMDATQMVRDPGITENLYTANFTTPDEALDWLIAQRK